MMTETLSPIRLNCVSEANRLSLKQDPGTNRFEILDDKTGQTLGSILRDPASPHEVELYCGKGGFMAMISAPNGLLYFALPGSLVKLPDLELNLPGNRFASSPDKQPSPKRTVTPQTFTNQATILGAGLATRFERISGESTHCSKPGVPLVGNRTVIECIANMLALHGFTRLLVNTYFKPDSVKDSLSRSDAREVLYIDENEPSGTAGGLRKMLLDSRHQGLLDESKPLLVVQGDAVTDADFSALMAVHVAHDALITIGCQFVNEEDVDKFGIIVTDRSGTDGESGKIIGFQEKPPRALAKSRLANTGFYILSPKAYPVIREIYQDKLDQSRQKARQAGGPVPEEIAFDFANDIFPAVLERVQADPALGDFRAETVAGYWSDIGNPRQYIESIHDIYAGKVNIPLPDMSELYYHGGVIFWEGAMQPAMQEHAKLEGNIVVARPYPPAK
jgi:NDP-sugar pyrophosphorylase family protein